MSGYAWTDYVDGVTPLDEAHFDKIEQALRKRQSSEGASLTAAGSITVTDGVHAVATGAASIITINGGVAGQLLTLYATAGNTFTLDTGGNIVGALPLPILANQAVLLYYTGTAWRVIASPVAAGGGGGGGLDWEGVWAAATAYVKGDVVTYNGVTYGAVNDSTGQTPPAAPGAGALAVIPLLTALPASPFDGMEIILTDSLTAPTYTWRLRYVAAKATNKWVFVGGSAAYQEIQPTTLETTPGTMGDCATVGPTLTIPVAGLYEITTGFTGDHASTGGYAYMNYSVAGAATQTADELRPWLDGGRVQVAVRTRQRTFPVGTVVAKYQGGTNVQVSRRWMRIEPVAVGG